MIFVRSEYRKKLGIEPIILRGEWMIQGRVILYHARMKLSTNEVVMRSEGMPVARSDTTPTPKVILSGETMDIGCTFHILGC